MKNTEKNQVLSLAEQIPVKDGSVVSLNLERKDGFEISLYSFSAGESISEQVSFGDTFYYVIQGEGNFGPEKEMKAGEALLVPHGTPHWSMAKTGLQILYIQVMKGNETEKDTGKENGKENGKGENDMFIKNFVHNEVVELAEQVQFEKGKIVSKSLVQRDDLTMTLFAFDEGEGVSTHAAAGDAFVVVLEGEAAITVDGVTKTAVKGQSIIMPANIPHAVKAVKPYKMLLVVVKEERN